MKLRLLGFTSMLLCGGAFSALAQNYDAGASRDIQEEVQREMHSNNLPDPATAGLEVNGAPNTAMLNDMVSQLQNVQTCMKQSDPNGFSEMNRQGYEVQQEVARLCKAGNQEKAQKLSLSFANEFKQSSSYKTMSKCAPQAYMQMAEMMLGSVSQPQGTDASVNVCDHIQAVQNQNH